jgi:L-2-hydroxycarboxylate dehydrogenase (NAD+)
MIDVISHSALTLFMRPRLRNDALQRRSTPDRTEGSAMPRIQADALRDAVAAGYRAVGLPDEDALLCAEWELDADLAGIASHGTVRVGMYLDAIDRGRINPRPNITMTQLRPGAVSIDGDNGMGAVVGVRGMAEAVRCAKVAGIGIATTRGSNHYGRAAFFLKGAVEAGCIGLTVSNGAPVMASYGGSQAVICTNPLAAATPVVDTLTPFAMDIASSVGNFGKIRVAERERTAIPEGWAVDAEGNPTTDPDLAVKGALLPFGGPKGSALAMLVEVLAGVLSGGNFGTDVGNPNRDRVGRADVGHTFIAIDVAAFMPVEQFAQRIDRLADMITGARPMAGFDAVRFPGQGTAERRKQTASEGIVMPASGIAALKAALEPRGVAMPQVTD